MDDDGLQTENELQEATFLIEVHNAVEFDVVPASGEYPVLIDQLLPGDCIVHRPQVNQPVVDLEGKGERDAEQHRMVGDTVQPADDEQPDGKKDRQEFVDQQLPPVRTDTDILVWKVF